MSVWILRAAVVADVAASLVVAVYTTRALATALLIRGADRARLLMADGVLAALSLGLVGSLLKAMALQNWHQIGMFAFVLGLRTGMKQVFIWERSAPAFGRAQR